MTRLDRRLVAAWIAFENRETLASVAHEYPPVIRRTALAVFLLILLGALASCERAAPRAGGPPPTTAPVGAPQPDLAWCMACRALPDPRTSK